MAGAPHQKMVCKGTCLSPCQGTTWRWIPPSQCQICKILK